MKKNMLCLLLCGSMIASAPLAAMAETTTNEQNKETATEETKTEEVKAEELTPAEKTEEVKAEELTPAEKTEEVKMEELTPAEETKKGIEVIESVYLPSFEGFKSAEVINSEIKKSADAGLLEVTEAAKTNSETQPGATYSFYARYSVNEGDKIISVPVQYSNFTGGAHGMTNVISYTALKDGEKLLTVDDLFVEGKDYKKAVKDIVKAEIAKEKDLYFENAAETVDKNDFNFYLKKDTVVVYYSLYEIAPYAAGIRYFEISVEDLKDYLKPEMYEAIKGIEETSKVTLNGENVEEEIKFEHGLIAIRPAAEVLGYEVGWSAETGVTFNGEAVDIKDEKQVNVEDRIYIDPTFFDNGENIAVTVTNDGVQFFKK